MKKTILTSVLLLSITVLFGQQTDNTLLNKPKPFNIDASVGYAVPLTSDIRGGFIVAIEPKYFVTPNLSLGLRIEGAFKARGVLDLNNNAEYTNQLTTSAIITGDYYFIKKNNYKQFVGFGTGIYNIGKFDVTHGNYRLESNNYVVLGAMVRLGLAYKNYNFGIEYNMLGKTPTTFTNVITNVATEDVITKNSYIGIKVGYTFGK